MPSFLDSMGGGGPNLNPQTLSEVIGRMRQEADRAYGLQKQQLDNSYKVDLMNARTAQDVARANAKYQQGQLALAREQLQFDREVQAQEFGLKQAGLGYNLLEMGANLRGPANVFQAAEFNRGVSSMPQTSTFLSALQNNARLPGFTAQGGLPAPETLNTLMAKMGGDATGGVVGVDPNNALASIGNIAAKGAHQLGAGALEQLTPDEYGIFTSGLDKLGISTPSFLDSYKRSRIGQGFGASRAA